VNFIVHVDIQVTNSIISLAIKDVSENQGLGENPLPTVGGFQKDWQKGVMSGNT